MNLLRYFLTLLVVLLLYNPLSAQVTDKDGQFYLGFAGSAVFPYDPKGQSGPGGEGINFKAGTGFTAAFGYAFKEGFSTEIEWGYQKAGIGGPTANLSQNIDLGGGIGVIGFEDFEIPSITIEIDGAIKTQSLMGNFYYRYPKWRVSPYVGFGLGSFFHDGTFTSTVTFETEGIGVIPPPAIGIISGIISRTDSLKATVAYDDSRFAYQTMGGLSARVSKRVEFHFGYRFRSSRGEPIDADQIEVGLRFWF